MSSQELKPCPIPGCGGEGKTCTRSDGSLSGVACRKCDLMVPGPVDRWQSLPRQSDALRDIVEEMENRLMADGADMAVEIWDFVDRLSQIADGGECERCAELDRSVEKIDAAIEEMGGIRGMAEAARSRAEVQEVWEVRYSDCSLEHLVSIHASEALAIAKAKRLDAEYAPKEYHDVHKHIVQGAPEKHDNSDVHEVCAAYSKGGVYPLGVFASREAAEKWGYNPETADLVSWSVQGAAEKHTRCPARHPEYDVQCGHQAGHEGPHWCQGSRWEGDYETIGTADNPTTE